MAKLKLFKNKDKERREALENTGSIFIPALTSKCFAKIRKDLNPDVAGDIETEIELYKNNFDARIEDMIDELYQDYTPVNTPTARVITLDDEFISWLSENHKTPTADVALEYMQGISEEKATELLKKNHLDRTCEVFLIPFILGVPAPEARKGYVAALSGVQRMKWENYLKSVFTNSEVYAFEYMLPAEMIDMCLEDLRNIGAAGIENNVHILKEIYREPLHLEMGPDITDSTLCISTLYLPFVIQRKTDSAFVDLADWFNEQEAPRPDDFPEEVMLSKEALPHDILIEDPVIKPNVYVEDAGIDKMFGEEVLPDFILTPFWFSVMGEDVLDADNAICGSLLE